MIFAASILTAKGKNKVELAPNDPCRKILAYVEWFTKAPKEPHQALQMFPVQRVRDTNGEPVGSVIELSTIVQPCYLVPRFDSEARKLGGGININGNNCLELIDKFWINSFQDQFTYQTIF